jgi:aromatic ring-opening dioxygenase catalytic subunit (LigB family)
MGGPADTWNRTEAWLRGLLASLPERPKGIVVISGHWEEKAFTASTATAPRMIYDYNGFPPHTYQLQYPAPGAPALAERVVELLTAAGLPARTDPNRGFDHGVFIPFLLIAPDADIPIVPLSLKSDLKPEEHLAAGRALAALRDEGILIVGSGMSFHNMRAYGDPRALPYSEAFDQWLTSAAAAEPAERAKLFAGWADAPAGRVSHPREEHLLPLMVAAGASTAPGHHDFGGAVMGTQISGYRFG